MKMKLHADTTMMERLMARAAESDAVHRIVPEFGMRGPSCHVVRVQLLRGAAALTPMLVALKHSLAPRLIRLVPHFAASSVVGTHWLQGAPFGCGATDMFAMTRGRAEDAARSNHRGLAHERLATNLTGTRNLGARRISARPTAPHVPAAINPVLTGAKGLATRWAYLLGRTAREVVARSAAILPLAMCHCPRAIVVLKGLSALTACASLLWHGNQSFPCRAGGVRSTARLSLALIIPHPDGINNLSPQLPQQMQGMGG